MDARTQYIEKITLSALKKILYNYQNSSVFYNVYRRIGFTDKKSLEEREYEALLQQISSNREQDALTAEEVLKFVNYAYNNPDHALGKALFVYFYPVKGRENDFDLLTICRDKKILTADILHFLFDLPFPLRHDNLWFYLFIKRWDCSFLPITRSLLHYVMIILNSNYTSYDDCAEILLSLYSIDLLNQKAVEMIATVHYKTAILDVLKKIHQYNIAYPEHASDVDLSFIIDQKYCVTNLEHLVEQLTSIHLLKKDIISFIGVRFVSDDAIQLFLLLQQYGSFNQKNIDWVFENRFAANHIVETFKVLSDRYPLDQLIDDFPVWQIWQMENLVADLNNHEAKDCRKIIETHKENSSQNKMAPSTFRM